MEAFVGLWGDSTDTKGLDDDIIRRIRIRAQVVAMRAESLRYLDRQVGRMERLLKESPVESLTPNEFVALDDVLAQFKRLTDR